MSDDPVKAALDAGLTLPPPGWSARAKAEWPNLPECLRADIARREIEMDAGMRRYAGLGKYVEKAERNGTTLGVELAGMRQLEKIIRRLLEDPVGGLNLLCWRYGYDPEEVANEFLRRSGEPDKEDA
ncbi:hypothetical protein [Methylocella sp.]|uniref:hypothetical protein n=1 Tax=Methylocella sp. TaxID=1978226 RepID=UPI0035B2F76F